MMKRLTTHGEGMEAKQITGGMRLFKLTQGGRLRDRIVIKRITLRGETEVYFSHSV